MRVTGPEGEVLENRERGVEKEALENRACVGEKELAPSVK